MRSRTALWGLAALLGIAVTATLAWTASQIAGQRIGLSSEPLSVSSGLAPAVSATARPRPPAKHRAHHARPAHSSGQAMRTVTMTSGSAVTPAPPMSAPAAVAPTGTPATPSPAPSTVTQTQSPPPSSGHEDNGGGGSGSGGGSGGGGGGSSGGAHRDD